MKKAILDPVLGSCWIRFLKEPWNYILDLNICIQLNHPIYIHLSESRFNIMKSMSNSYS